MGILLGAGPGHLEPLDQLLAHAAVRLQLEAQHHQAQFVRVGQPLGEQTLIDRELAVQPLPEGHDPRPAFGGVAVHGPQLLQQRLHALVGLGSVVAVVHHHFLYDLPLTARLDLRLSAAHAARKQTQPQDQRESPRKNSSPPVHSMVRMSEKPVTSKISMMGSPTWVSFIVPCRLMIFWVASSTRSPAEEI